MSSNTDPADTGSLGAEKTLLLQIPDMRHLCKDLSCFFQQCLFYRMFRVQCFRPFGNVKFHPYQRKFIEDLLEDPPDIFHGEPFQVHRHGCHPVFLFQKFHRIYGRFSIGSALFTSAIQGFPVFHLCRPFLCLPETLSFQISSFHPR